MRRGNSKKDPRLVEAQRECARLLIAISEWSDRASEEYDACPRWSGIPGPDADLRKNESRWWSHRYPIPENNQPVDQNSAGYLHSKYMLKFSRKWLEHAKSVLSPRQMLDTVRGELRYADRLDETNWLTRTFALLECKRKGRSKLRDDGSRYQDYEYVPLPITTIETFPVIMELSRAMRRTFDHCALALMPRALSADDRKFLTWIATRDGQARNIDVIRWLEAVGITRSGQDPSAGFLRDFCDKTRSSGSRSPWAVRPEAIDILESTL